MNQRLQNALAYVVARMGEGSTWAGLVLILTASGITVSPERASAITAIGLGLAGLIRAAFPDKVK